MYLKHQQCPCILLILVILSCWSECSWGYGMWDSTNDIIENPNIPCPGKNEPMNWPNCTHGGYIENHDPENCADRYVCYAGLDEFCYRGFNRCANNAICTSCGICQKCESPEKCSPFRLCPGKMMQQKRFMQKRLMEYMNE